MISEDGQPCEHFGWFINCGATKPQKSDHNPQLLKRNERRSGFKRGALPLFTNLTLYLYAKPAYTLYLLATA